MNEKPFKIGTCIVKKNKQVFGRANQVRPSIKIGKVVRRGDHHYIINGIYTIDPEMVEVIPEEEANRINRLYKSLEISETGKPGQTGTHYRTIDGKEKLGYPSKGRAKAALFHRLLTKPDEDYDAYLCPECDKRFQERLKDEE
jgi:hypothetical protein